MKSLYLVKCKAWDNRFVIADSLEEALAIFRVEVRKEYDGDSPNPEEDDVDLEPESVELVDDREPYRR